MYTTVILNDESTHISPQRLLKHAFDQIRHSKPDIHPDNQEREIQKLITLLFSSGNALDICRAILDIEVFKSCLWKLFLGEIQVKTLNICALKDTVI